MASPAGTGRAPTQWPAPAPAAEEPPKNGLNDQNEDGVSVRPMRLKVLYTFDDQNKTNCLARGQDVLQIQTVALDETTSIGILDLKTCIEAVIQCSPELVSRLGQDYTVYAYDYSEYDNPLVGQGMLSKALAAASPAPNVPAQQSAKLITGRVCKNILGIFNNGVKETLEVKLRLVPVPTTMQGEYVNTMDKYRDMNSSLPLGFDHHEWTKFLQSNPNMGQMTTRYGTPGSNSAVSNQRGSMNMEVVSQLLSPSMLPHQMGQDQPALAATNQVSNANTISALNMDSGNESRGSKVKKTSRPSSRTSIKRPRAKRQPKAPASNNGGGNTSGYEEGTDGDDGPAPKKRAKITQAAWNSKSAFGLPSDRAGSLRVTASTASSLRMFRPIAMSPVTNPASHLEELPRPPTPLPNLPNLQAARSQSSLRRDSFASQNERQQLSPYPPFLPPGNQEDQIRVSIESANNSPERNDSPALTPLDIASSPPVIGMRSSPPCPSSPILPEMPRTDSGFMSGAMDELFGDDFEQFCPAEEEAVELPPPPPAQAPPKTKTAGRKSQSGPSTSRPSPYPYSRPSSTPGPVSKATEIEVDGFVQIIPGPMDLLPTKMPIFKPLKAPVESLMSDDGQQSLPRMKTNSKSNSPHPTTIPRQSDAQPSLTTLTRPHDFQPPPSAIPAMQNSLPQQGQTQPLPAASAPSAAPRASSVKPSAARQRSKISRTASTGVLQTPAGSGPAVPLSTLQRSQTWSVQPEPQPKSKDLHPCEQVFDQSGKEVTGTTSHRIRKAALKQKLEEAIANGQMPPYCSNCGAIETPVWRKAWSQSHVGVPPYFNFSDEPGRVTAVLVLTRDADEQPTSYQVVKKYLGDGEDQANYNEFFMCNPCGIWLGKYKFLPSEANWDSTKKKAKNSSKKDSGPAKKRPVQRKPAKAASEANLPQSDAFPPSEINYPQSEAAAPVDITSPTDTTGDVQIQRVELPATHLPANTTKSTKRLNPMTSDAASQALRNALKSSPARWNGTRNQPEDISGDSDSTRRVLFPSPRKDGAPLLLSEASSNLTPRTLKDGDKDQVVDTPNKENCPPPINDADDDAELMKLFEEELARPSTPVQNTEPAQPFKTPTRPTPNHRPITRSVSRSIRSTRSARDAVNLIQRTPSKTPTRRSPRNHDACNFMSPFTAGIQEMMNEANNNFSPSRNGMAMDFGDLHDLSLMGNELMPPPGTESNIEFDLDEFFSAEAMPGSPSSNFHLYEDPNAMADIDWAEFNNIDTTPSTVEVEKKVETKVVIKQENSDDEVDLVESSP